MSVQTNSSTGSMQLFSSEWQEVLRNEWNRKDGLARQLRQLKFNSVVAFGVPQEQQPRAYLVIRNGEIIEMEAPKSAPPQWDLRADESQWQSWFADPPGLLALGMAFTNKSLQFRQGNYPDMIKDPLMAESFVRSFALISRAQKKIESSDQQNERKCS
jgi:hypothetical protein